MTAGLRIAARAAAQVLLVSASSVMLAAYQATGDGGRLGLAGGVGFLISWVWWTNAQTAATATAPGARLWYACGAMVGTLTGAALARALVG